MLMGSGRRAPQPSGALVARLHAAVDGEPFNGHGTKRPCRSVDELSDCGEMGMHSTREIGRSSGVDGHVVHWSGGDRRYRRRQNQPFWPVREPATRVGGLAPGIRRNATTCSWERSGAVVARLMLGERT